MVHGQAESRLGVHAEHKVFDVLVYNSARASEISLGRAGKRESAWARTLVASEILLGPRRKESIL